MKVFQISDCEWWMAETAQQARDAAIETYGSDDYIFPLDEVVEVSSESMERMIYNVDDEQTITCSEHLSKRIQEGATKPELFAWGD